MAQQKTKQKTKHKEPISRSSMLSEERIVNSDSDSPEEPEAVLSKPTSKQPAPVKKSFEKTTASTNGKKHQTPESRLSSDEEAANDEENATEDEASGEDSDNETDASPSSGTKRPAPSAQAAPPRKKVKPTPPIAIAPKAFKPPKGFEKTTLSASDYAAGSTEFLTEDLTGKQIWHISAPASVSIEDIKPFNIQDVRSGKPIFSKNGVDYGFLTGSHKIEKLLLATGDSVEYAQASAPISGTYHLREMASSKLKNDADEDKENSVVSFAARSIVTSKEPREQPVGLRMRYQPYGSFAASKDQGSSTSPPTFRMAPQLPECQSDKSARKKARKERRASQQAKESSQDFDPMDFDLTPSSTIKNPESGKRSESATTMVNKVFEAATETPSQEKKRKKKKHRIADEAAP